MGLVSEFDDYLTACSHVTSVDGLKQVFTRFAAAEGFENNVLTSLGERRLKSVEWFDFPDPYPEAYIANQWEREDPIVELSLVARRPFVWEDVLKTRKLRRSQAIFMAESTALKVRDGITFPMHGPNGRCEILSISCRERPDFDPARLDLLRIVAAQTWWKFVDLGGEATFDEFDDSRLLTRRQRDVLLWIRDGKTNTDIAEIMNLSAKTVEFHVSNILDRLGASNRITAVVIALQRGLI
jgi:DNA-binding CsgD family transcriptional regulator